MRIGVVKEIKQAEKRVALTPAGTEELARSGHSVLVEAGAGEGSGFADGAYLKCGGRGRRRGGEDLGRCRHAREGQGARRPRARSSS